MAVVTALVASLVSGAFAVSLLRRYLQRRGNLALLFWGLALTMFCIASVALLGGVVGGWSSPEFRAFYLFGAVLNVPWLALGSVTVNARAPIVSRITGAVLLVVALLFARGIAGGGETALWLPGLVLGAVWGVLLVIGVRGAVVAGSAAALVVYTALGTAAVMTGDFQQALPATGLPEGSELFLPAVRGYAVGGNAVGAIAVIVGALAASATMVWRRPDREADHDLAAQARRGAPVEALAHWVFRGRTGAPVVHLVRGNLYIALGVLLAAAGGVLSFLGETVGHAIGFTVGVVVMYAGFLRTTRPIDT